MHIRHANSRYFLDTVRPGLSSMHKLRVCRHLSDVNRRMYSTLLYAHMRVYLHTCVHQHQWKQNIHTFAQAYAQGSCRRVHAPNAHDRTHGIILSLTRDCALWSGLTARKRTSNVSDVWDTLIVLSSVVFSGARLFQLVWWPDFLDQGRLSGTHAARPRVHTRIQMPVACICDQSVRMYPHSCVWPVCMHHLIYILLACAYVVMCNSYACMQCMLYICM